MDTQRPFVLDSLHLAVLSAFAVAQPLLDLLGRRPEFFAMRRSEPVDVLLLPVLLCLVLPLPLILLGALARLADRRLQRGLHAVLVAALVAAIVLPPLARTLAAGPWLPVGCAVLLAAAAAAAVDRLRSARLLLTFLIPALAVFPAVFLLRPGIGRVIDRSVVESVAFVDSTTPVVLVIFDELPITSLLAGPRQIDAVRYPNFAALADRSTWYRNAATVSDFTMHAVPAILSGRLPDNSRLPIAPDHPHSLFTLLGESYAMNVHESVTQVCPSGLCGTAAGGGLGVRLGSLASDLGVLYLHLLLPAEWAAGLPPVSQNWMLFAGQSDWLSDWKDRTGTDRSAQLERFLAGIVRADGGVLHLLHLLLPHPPFEYLPTGQFYSLENDVVGLDVNTLADDEWAAVQNHQRHLLQLGYVDRVLGRIVSRLEAAGLWDRAVVVVTADHGVAFTAGGSRRSLTHENLAQILPVPLLIKAPGQRKGKLDERPAATIDILPTIVELLGIDLPWPVDGVSLAGPATADREQLMVLPHSNRTGPPVEVAFSDIAAGERRARSTLDARFGVAADGGRELYRVGRRRRLIGRAVAELRRGEPTDFRHLLHLPLVALDVEPGGFFVPAHLAGRLVDVSVAEPVELAVAVNGQIAAVTTTWTFAPDRFSAIVDPAVLRAGTNKVELFALSGGGSEADPVLRPVPAVATPPEDGLLERGLHGVETWDTGPVRWTDGDAEITFAVYRPRPPRRLRLTLVGAPPGGGRLRVSANGKLLLRTRLESVAEDRPWSTTLDLGGVDFGDRLRIALESDSFVPDGSDQGSPDARRLGVAISGFELLEDEGS